MRLHDLLDLEVDCMTWKLIVCVVSVKALCADGTIPFVSLTGKTNDLTKIKGWRDKYSSSSELPHITPQGELAHCCESVCVSKGPVRVYV